MMYHILNGDALAEKFPTRMIPGDLIIWREAFMDGPVTDRPDEEYWKERAAYIADAHNVTPAEYPEKFLSQIKKVRKIEMEDEVYLWFEDDLFCQVNMWFAVRLLWDVGIKNIYRVFPVPDSERWMGFGGADDAEMQQCFQQAVKFNTQEIEFVIRLWSSYVKQDNDELVHLSRLGCNGIRFLKQVLQAHVDRMPNHGTATRPQKVLKEIIAGGANTFATIFQQFYLREGIYGYGDVQVRRMLNEMGFKG